MARETIHARLRKRRLELGLSQDQLAVLTGFTQNHIWHWERDRIPPLDYLPHLAKGLKTSVPRLLYRLHIPPRKLEKRVYKKRDRSKEPHQVAHQGG